MKKPSANYPFISFRHSYVQPPAFSHQLPAFSIQPLVFSLRPPTFTIQQQASNLQTLSTSFQPSTTSIHPPASSLHLPDSSLQPAKPSATNFQISGPSSPALSHQPFTLLFSLIFLGSISTVYFVIQTFAFIFFFQFHIFGLLIKPIDEQKSLFCLSKECACARMYVRQEAEENMKITSLNI